MVMGLQLLKAIQMLYIVVCYKNIKLKSQYSRYWWVMVLYFILQGQPYRGLSSCVDGASAIEGHSDATLSEVCTCTCTNVLSH